MRKVLVIAIVLVVVGAAGVLVAQQKYPSNAEASVKLDNDKVVVQEISFKEGVWTGEHSHEGGQLVVILDDTKMLYREGGEEVERSFSKGDVFWIEPVTHDHMAISSGKAMLVSFK